MSTKMSAGKALSHNLTKGAILEVVDIISRGGTSKNTASAIVNEYAAKVMDFALIRPVLPPNLAAEDWKSAWAVSSLGAFMICEDGLTIAYAMKIHDSGNEDKGVYRLLIKLATALAGIVRLIHCGLDPEVLLR